MRKKKHKIGIVIAIILLLFNIKVTNTADASVGRIVVDGTVLLDLAPEMIEGRMMVPMRPIFEALGAEVTWSGELQAVYASKDDREVYLEIGKRQGMLGLRSVQLEVAPYVIQGRTMVPLRFVSESLGAEVNWDAATKTAFIETETTGSPQTEKQQIRAKWATYKPTYEGSPYEIEPQVYATYKIGKLHDDFIQDGVNMANFMRYLAGLPDDLVATDTLNERAQHGAVLLQAFGELTHYPQQPADMPDRFYEQGALSTKSSNISQYRYSTTGQTMDVLAGLSPGSSLTLASSVDHYMRDEDDSNVATVGHRRWILNPSLKQVGFGYSHRYTEEGEWKHYERYATMEIMDRGARAAEIDYDHVAWPSAGYFPTDLFGSSEKYGSDPWSISLNPDRYKTPNINQVQVTLTELDSGQSWTLDQTHIRLQAKKAFFQVNLVGYGIPYAIIFRPDETAQYGDGSHYEVKVTGLQDASGRSTEINYETIFFDL